jgi:hypothetical protein
MNSSILRDGVYRRASKNAGCGMLDAGYRNDLDDTLDVYNGQHSRNCSTRCSRCLVFCLFYHDSIVPCVMRLTAFAMKQVQLDRGLSPIARIERLRSGCSQALTASAGHRWPYSFGFAASSIIGTIDPLLFLTTIRYATNITAYA